MPIRASPNGPRHFIHTVLSPWHLAVTLGWNGWSPSIGNSGHHQERVVTLPGARKLPLKAIWQLDFATKNPLSCR